MIKKFDCNYYNSAPNIRYICLFKALKRIYVNAWAQRCIYIFDMNTYNYLERTDIPCNVDSAIRYGRIEGMCANEEEKLFFAVVEEFGKLVLIDSNLDKVKELQLDINPQRIVLALYIVQ